MENPERRRFERNPVGLVLADRAAYVTAILTIARAYILAGRPDKPAPYMSFGGWSDLVRGALMWLGCADPVATGAGLGRADPGREEREEVFHALHGVMRERAMTTAQLIEAAKDDAPLRGALLIVARDDKSGEINPRRLGRWLLRTVDKIADGLKLGRRDETRPPQWVVRKQPRGRQSRDAASAG
jgi:putative DNA primase/helicase